IDAMKALGASDIRIIFKHILPNIVSPIIVQASLYIATAVLSASGLSFLGMGAQPPSPELGAILSDGRDYMWDAGHITLFPGLVIMMIVLAFNVFGDGLRDALDPTMKREKVGVNMLQFIVRRLIKLLRVLIAVTIVVFSLMHLTPCNPAHSIAGESAPKETVEQIEERLGLNDPITIQYFSFVKDAAMLQFGYSWRTSLPVTHELWPKFWVTFELAVYS